MFEASEARRRKRETERRRRTAREEDANIFQVLMFLGLAIMKSPLLCSSLLHDRDADVWK
jgi:hypothetical protein